MKLQLQSILLPDRDICDVEGLYLHRDAEDLLFDGYFNLFYIEKRKAYTQIENLSLQLTLQGYESLTLMHDETPIGYVSLEAEEKQEYLIDLPYEMYDEGVFWFKLKKAEQETGEEKTEKFTGEIGEKKPEKITGKTGEGKTVEGKTEEEKREADGLPGIIEGFYVTDIAEEKVRAINIGIDICTYKREDCVIRNIMQIKTDILFNDSLDAASHFYVYLIDNGKTLEENPQIIALQEECGNKLKVFPNKNCGGAGGFTRGMLEVLNDKKKLGLTHVLLMDDDVILESDALVRTYGLLATLKDEWKDVTVGGAMLREDFPGILYCAGEHWEGAYIHNDLMNTDLQYFSNASSPILTEAGHEYDCCSGWWLCCYSLNTVSEDNLPLPLFVHQDDIEYGLRNQDRGVIFLNGICVWHRIPELTYPNENLYYDIRNNLIEIALYEKKSRQRSTAAKLLFKAITTAVIRLRYADARLVYQGFLDFLKGPQWLDKIDSEKLHEKLRNLTLSMRPVEEVLNGLSEKDKAAARRQLKEYKETYSKNAERGFNAERHHIPMIGILTFNGWLLPADKGKIKLVASTDSPYKGFRKERILIYEPGTGRAMEVTRTKEGMKEVLKIYRKTLALFIRYFKKACKNWQENAYKLTDKKAWERYLKG